MLRRTIPPALRAKSTGGPTRVCVAATPDGWEVRKEGARASITFPTQDEALRAAQSKLQKSGGELRIQGRNGRAKETYTLGGSAMSKLAAIEGITFTPAMKRKIKAAQDPTLSIEERRKILSDGLSKGRR